jgi:hypothetical protein
MCIFQSLYFGNDGYVVHCKECNHYQLTYMSTMLTLTECDFQSLYTNVKYKCAEADYSLAEHSKTVIIQTPTQGVGIFLIRFETVRFSEILEEADNESKAQALIRLFNA